MSICTPVAEVEGVGSASAESNGFQILKDNAVILENGSSKAADENAGEFYILVQNYADLTVENMSLDGTNLDKWATRKDLTTNGDSYVVSNNCGTVVVKGDTGIIANNEGSKAFAFDVCDKTANGYTAPKVSVETAGTINGKIEVSEYVPYVPAPPRLLALPSPCPSRATARCASRPPSTGARPRSRRSRPSRSSP